MTQQRVISHKNDHFSKLKMAHHIIYTLLFNVNLFHLMIEFKPKFQLYFEVKQLYNDKEISN